MYDKASLALIPSGVNDGTLYSVLPANGDGDFTHSRGSTATRVNKDGLIESVATNVPRLDYTGNVDCPHLLLEPQRTNSIPYSEDFTQWAVQSGTTITSNTTETLSPSGEDNASKIVSNGSNGFYVQAAVAGVVSRSIYLKSVTGTVNVKLKDPSLTVTTKTLSVTENWQRFELVENNGHASMSGLWIDDIPSSGIYAWGGQLEQGDYTTSYILTSGSTVTRSADVCNSAGTSAEFNDSEGVIFAELSALANDGTNRRIAIPNSGTTGLHRIELSSTDNRVFGVTYVSPSNQAAIGHTLTDVTTTFKIAYKYKANDFALWVNGVEVGTDSSGSVPTGLTELNFDNGSGNDDFYGKVKQLIYFNEALSDSELQTLTS